MEFNGISIEIQSVLYLGKKIQEIASKLLLTFWRGLLNITIHRNPGFHGVPCSSTMFQNQPPSPKDSLSCCETVHVHLCLSAQLSGGAPPRPKAGEVRSYGSSQSSKRHGDDWVCPKHLRTPQINPNYMEFTWETLMITDQDFWGCRGAPPAVPMNSVRNWLKAQNHDVFVWFWVNSLAL